MCADEIQRGVANRRRRVVEALSHGSLDRVLSEAMSAREHLRKDSGPTLTKSNKAGSAVIMDCNARRAFVRIATPGPSMLVRIVCKTMTEDACSALEASRRREYASACLSASAVLRQRFSFWHTIRSTHLQFFENVFVGRFVREFGCLTACLLQADVATFLEIRV